jgi:hypothetical protein
MAWKEEKWKQEARKHTRIEMFCLTALSRYCIGVADMCYKNVSGMK